MFLSFIILTSTLVIVRARNLNTEIIKDHVPVPKYDFSSHEVDFARIGDREESSSDEFIDHGSREVHNHGTFNVEFNHRQMPPSVNGQGNGRNSESSLHDSGLESINSKFHDFSNEHSNNCSHRSKHRERTDHATGSTESERTKIRDSNVEDMRNMDRRHKSRSYESNYDVDHNSSDLASGNFEGRFHGNNFDEQGRINKRVNQNNMQRTHFNSNDRKTEEQNAKEVDEQMQENEKYFDNLASSHTHKSHDNNERRGHMQKNRQNIQLISRSHFNNSTSARMQHKEKSDNEFVTTAAPKKGNPGPSSREYMQMDQRPIFQTSPKPAVTDSKNDKNKNDMWIWSEDSGNKPPATNSTSTKPTKTTVDVDDRAAFNGDKCPTGSVRVGLICASVD